MHSHHSPPPLYRLVWERTTTIPLPKIVDIAFASELIWLEFWIAVTVAVLILVGVVASFVGVFPTPKLAVADTAYCVDHHMNSVSPSFSA